MPAGGYGKVTDRIDMFNLTLGLLQWEGYCSFIRIRQLPGRQLSSLTFPVWEGYVIKRSPCSGQRTEGKTQTFVKGLRPQRGTPRCKQGAPTGAPPSSTFTSRSKESHHCPASSARVSLLTTQPTQAAFTLTQHPPHKHTKGGTQV